MSDLPENQRGLRVTVANGFSDFSLASAGLLTGVTLSARVFDDVGHLLAATTMGEFSGANDCLPPSFIC